MLAFLAALAGWISIDDLLAPRPRTDFIWKPDRWSFVVALLAGAAGTLALTSSRSNTMVGVFIAVTTVPAAANLAFALAVGLDAWLFPVKVLSAVAAGDTVWQEITGSVAQLLVNVGGHVRGRRGNAADCAVGESACDGTFHGKPRFFKNTEERTSFTLKIDNLQRLALTRKRRP